LLIAVVVKRKDVEILAWGVDHHRIHAGVRALPAVVYGARIEVVAAPIDADAEADDAGVHCAEQAVCTIVPTQTELRLRRDRDHRKQSHAQPEDGRTTPPR
jgi:hypothetical protein